MLRMSDKVTGECTISYNSDLNPTKKKEQRERERKVTLQWPWNYWFHRESLLEKRAQLLRVLTSLVPDHCFRGSGWIHSVVFIFAWQFSHQLARNISTPFAQQFPNDVTARVAKLRNVLISCLFPNIQLNPSMCVTVTLSSVINDIRPSGVTSALYTPWLICRSSNEVRVTSFLSHQIVIDGTGWPRSGSWYLTSTANVPERD